MKIKGQFPWDEFSDQPYVIASKAQKQAMCKQGRLDQLKMVIASLLVLPVAYGVYVVQRYWRRLRQSAYCPKFLQRDAHDHTLNQFFGIGVNLNTRYSAEQLHQLVEELGCNHVIIRIYLHEIERLDAFVELIKRFADKNIIVAVLQDRRHVEDVALFAKVMREIFERCSPYATRFQIGHAINRKKWAFITYDEYLTFYQVAQEIRDEAFPQLSLLGPSVIDFEYFATIRALFNGYRLKFDEMSSLLYVDRRGAPENKQLGLDLMGKIGLLRAIMWLSPKAFAPKAFTKPFTKTSQKFIITETNWSIKGTEKYSSTSEQECVNLMDYQNYMVRYYLLAIASGQVDQVYWHQLIAPGYGLIDDRKDLHKYSAFKAFAFMVKTLRDAKFISFEQYFHYNELKLNTKTQTLRVCWTSGENNSVRVPIDNAVVYNSEGAIIQPFECDDINARTGKAQGTTVAVEATASPIYVIRERNEH